MEGIEIKIKIIPPLYDSLKMIIAGFETVAQSIELIRRSMEQLDKALASDDT